jgi:hypothetical protein
MRALGGRLRDRLHKEVGEEGRNSPSFPTLASSSSASSSSFLGPQASLLFFCPSPSSCSSLFHPFNPLTPSPRPCRFVEREPTCLSRHPSWLLQGLEAFNQVLKLEPDQCLQFALRNTALVRDHRAPGKHCHVCATVLCSPIWC